MKAIGQVLFNQIFVGIPFTLFTYWVMTKAGPIPNLHELPSFSRVLIEFVFFIVVEEIAFYYSHRSEFFILLTTTSSSALFLDIFLFCPLKLRDN